MGGPSQRVFQAEGAPKAEALGQRGAGAAEAAEGGEEGQEAAQARGWDGAGAAPPSAHALSARPNTIVVLLGCKIPAATAC